jgi:DNA-binding CsgD family transcriptional regulator
VFHPAFVRALAIFRFAKKGRRKCVRAKLQQNHNAGGLQAKSTNHPPQPNQDSCVDNQALLDKLTAREREVLNLFLKLLNDKRVARQLGTRIQTVKNQLASIEHKLGVSSRGELIALALSLSQ